MKNLLTTFILLCIGFNSLANPFDLGLSNSMDARQKSKSKIDKTKIIVGPGFGLGAAQRAFFFNINPSIGYAITDNLTAGVSVGFSYLQQSQDYQNYVIPGKTETYKYKIPSYSVSLFARYMIANSFFVGIEPELNNTKYISNDYSYNATTGKVIEKSSRLTVPSFLAGAGYGGRIGDYGYYYFMAMYDFVQNPNARFYYQTIAVKTGFMFPLFNR